MNLSLIISDANILIDLANLKLLNVFAQLNFNSCVTDFVLEELNEEQQVKVKELEKDGKIQILTSDSNDILEIAKLTAKSSGLSVQDCSVWYFCMKFNALMLTGDKKLRKEAESNNIKVRGILFIIDELLLQKILNFDQAISALEQLKSINNRLPFDEINRRLIEWKM